MKLVMNDQGAASALKWISDQESLERRNVEKARVALDLALENQRTRPPESDGEDYEQRVRECRNALDDCVDRVQKWQKQLLSFDTKISPERRDSTERLPREEVERLAKMIAINFRTASVQVITDLCARILECRSEVQVHQIIAPKINEILSGVFDSALREKHIPAWLAKAVCEIL